MSSCGNNTLMIARPTLEAQQQAGCGPACGGLGPFDCDPTLRRSHRGKIIEQLTDYILLKLGAPTIRLEIDMQAVDMLIKEVLKWVEYYAPREFFSFYTFVTSPGQSVYRMPPDVGYIRAVNYRQHPDFAFQSADLQGSIPIEYFYPGGAYSSIQGGLIDPIQPIWGRAGEWTLYKQYERMYTRLSSSLGGWEWVNGYRDIKLYPIPFRAYYVSAQYMQKCKDWHEVELAMLEGVEANVKKTLGYIWRKYRNPPGPNGGMQLSGTEMYQEGEAAWKEWKEELIYRFGEVSPITLG